MESGRQFVAAVVLIMKKWQLFVENLVLVLMEVKWTCRHDNRNNYIHL